MAKANGTKVTKPRPDFPLFPHASGRWAKKVLGRLVYFGSTAADPKGEQAARIWADQKDDLLAGRTPRARIPGTYTSVQDLVNEFLSAKRDRLRSGELTAISFDKYYRTCELLIKRLGKSRAVEDLGPDDFREMRTALAKNLGPHALMGAITRVRVVMKYAFDNLLIDKPVQYGSDFERPSRATMRRARNAAGKKMLTQAELRSIIDAAQAPVKAMVLLGVNCGFGAKDCSDLTLGAVQLPERPTLEKPGWLDFARFKTGVARRCPLWPETVTALKEALEARPTPVTPEAENRLFVTKYGNFWVRTRLKTDKDGNPTKASTTDAVGQEFKKLIRDLGIYRKQMGFYWLRHVTETIGSRTPHTNAQVALDAIMGHADDANDMAARYREGHCDDQLKAVANHIRDWLFANPGLSD